MNKQILSQIIDGPIVTWTITGLIFFSIICFSVETLPGLPVTTLNFLKIAEIAVVFIFTIEYLLRIYVSEKRLRFVFSFFGLIDLLAILPFYMATAFDLRSLRILRLFRLLRLLKLTRYHSAITRFGKALLVAKEELVIFIAMSLMLIFLSAVGIYHFENAAQPDKYRTIFDCLWWAVATLTTVGYGDVYPITIGGRLFTFGILLIGLGMVAVPTGIIASALSDARKTKS